MKPSSSDMCGQTVSVIIATHNRAATLKKALDAYAGQTAKERIREIVVVDDESTDGTAGMVADISKRHPVEVKYLTQSKSGAAAARNRGIRQAEGEFILFTDDDIIPAPKLVAEHLAFHEEFADLSLGVLGNIKWDPEVHPTPFMKWMGGDGALVSLSRFSRGEQVDFAHFYTGNVSVRKAFLMANGLFDESFRTYGYEDTELGFRLTRRGLNLRYNPAAVGLHHKRLSFADARRRASLIAAAARVFDTTEAGLYMKTMAGPQTLPKPQVKSPKQALKLLVQKLVPFFSPFLPILDSQIPLPWSIYRVLYQYYAERSASPQSQQQAGTRGLEFLQRHDSVSNNGEQVSQQ